MSLNLDVLREAVGRSEVRRARLSRDALARFALALGADADPSAAPEILAPWAVFTETSPLAALGPDGHPMVGASGLIPKIPLPRRMFAGAEAALERPLRLEVEAELATRVVDLRAKDGRTGPLVFVELERRLVQDGTTALVERQTLVYRGEGPPLPPIAPLQPPPAADQIWSPTAVELFRFSAATFNSHRIHYDAPYARDVEGYPGLVVHGPLTAAKLLILATGARPARRVRAFRFRAEAPLFAGAPVFLTFDAAAGAATAIRSDGALAVRADVTFEDAPERD